MIVIAVTGLATISRGEEGGREGRREGTARGGNDVTTYLISNS
jgi:hypothetical protein